MTAPTLTDLIYLKKNFLTRDQCDVIINEFESNSRAAVQEQCRHAFTDVDTVSTFKTKDARIGTESFSLIHRTIENMINEYHDYLDTFNAFHVMRRTTMMHPHKYRIMKYEKDAWIHPHVDHNMGIYGSYTINLNEDYEGGDFAFWGGRHKIKLGVGDVMIWPADFFWVHEVEEITDGTRYSANTFLCSQPYGLPKEVRYNIKHMSPLNHKSKIEDWTYEPI